MTGAEHHAHAEQLLDWAAEDVVGSDTERYHHATAQVHATLALVRAIESVAAAIALVPGAINIGGPS